MSTPETEHDDKLWISDVELIERLNVPEKTAREALRMLDAQRSGFPRKQELWGKRRYWPAVKAYFELHYGGTLAQPKQRESA